MKPSGLAGARFTTGDAVRNSSARDSLTHGLDELAVLAATGDRAAVRRLAERVHPMIVRYCRARIGRASGGYNTADDVAQEACLGIFAALPGYADKSCPFDALAYRIAANKVADHYRRHAANRSFPVENLPDHNDPAPTPEATMLANELSGHLRSLLGVLNSREREIVTLRVVVGMSAEETAQAVGSTRGAIRVAQHRALAKLRANITDSDESAWPPEPPAHHSSTPQLHSSSATAWTVSFSARTTTPHTAPSSKTSARLSAPP